MEQFSRKNVQFRSITDLKDFDDRTVISEPSVTDPSQHVPTEVLIGRIMRGEPYRRPVDQDFDILGGREDFAALDITTTDGFDLADVQPALQGAAEAPPKSTEQRPADARSVNADEGSATPLPTGSKAVVGGDKAAASVAQQGKEPTSQP